MRIPLITTVGAKEIAIAVALVVGLAVCNGALARAQATQPAPAPPAAVELPATIPLFPLPDVVLFPDVSLPLRIFEPRYRTLMADALKGNRLIGMVLLQPGHEKEYEGRPPIFAIGCAGVITQEEQLPNGEYTFVLRGLQKFRVTGENPGGAYRVARVTPLPEASLNASLANDIRAERQRIDKLLMPLIAQQGINPPPPDLSNEGLIIGLAQLLEFTMPEWQELLESEGLLARLRLLADRLETLGAPGRKLARRRPPLAPFFQGPGAHSLSG
jgi:Lon protease-like protein